MPGTTTVVNPDSRRTWAGQVADALARMPSDERAFILASYIEGRTHALIAAQAGVSDACVSRTIASGMRKLATDLEDSYRTETPPTAAVTLVVAPKVSRWNGRRRAKFDAVPLVDAAGF